MTGADDGSRGGNRGGGGGAGTGDLEELPGADDGSGIRGGGGGAGADSSNWGGDRGGGGGGAGLDFCDKWGGAVTNDLGVDSSGGVGGGAGTGDGASSLIVMISLSKINESVLSVSPVCLHCTRVPGTSLYFLHCQ